MKKLASAFILISLMCVGCSATKETKDKNETKVSKEKPSPTEIETREELAAAHHIYTADSLTQKSAFRRATNEYLLITKQYKATKYYAEAAYQTALLYNNPLNPSASDSAALFWFRKSLTLPITEQEKEKANIYIPMLERVMQLREELEKLREVDIKVNKRGGKK